MIPAKKSLIAAAHIIQASRSRCLPSDNRYIQQLQTLAMSEAIISLLCSLGVLLVASLGYNFLQPNGGTSIKFHLVYFVCAICLVAFLPASIANRVFTALSVALVGAMYPVYRATKAVCTPEEDDDKEWLQYWVSWNPSS